MFVVTVCDPVCDVINFEIHLSQWSKKFGQKSVHHLLKAFIEAKNIIFCESENLSLINDGKKLSSQLNL